MARKVDPALTRQAISWVRRVRSRADKSDDGTSPWEEEFLDSLEERLEHYGSAFSDPDKGQLSAPLSLRQGLKLRQIGKKGRPARPTDAEKPGESPQPSAKSTKAAKPRKGLQRRKPLQSKHGLRSKPNK